MDELPQSLGEGRLLSGAEDVRQAPRPEETAYVAIPSRVGGPHHVWRDHRLPADAVRGFQKGSGLRIGLLMFQVARAHFLQGT